MARQLLGEPDESERLVLVAPHGAELGGLELSLSAVAEFVLGTKAVAHADLATLPVATIDTSMLQRPTKGVLWTDNPKAPAIRFAVGRDGSIGLRRRLFLDRQGPGGARARGEVGVFTAIELLCAAILYAERLACEVDRKRSPTRWAFRIEHHGVKPARMMCDVPSTQAIPVPHVANDWPRKTIQSADPAIRHAGNYAHGVSIEDLARLLDDVAVALAAHFGVDRQVRELRPGSVVAEAYRTATTRQ